MFPKRDRQPMSGSRIRALTPRHPLRISSCVPEQSRREFLRATAALAGAAISPACAQDDDEQRVELRRPLRPTGVPTMWLGAMTPKSAVVKVKLPPRTPAELYVRSAGDAPIKFQPLPPRDPASTVATFAVKGLQPATTYT